MKLHGVGFEPTKHIATELKSVPVDRLGIRVGCSWWGSNPRPIAHKTIALTTELQELVFIIYYHTIPLSNKYIYNKALWI